MSTWILICPNCETPNDIPRDLILVDCGQVSCICTCVNCGSEFDGEQEFWRFLGLPEAPPAEKQPGLI